MKELSRATDMALGAAVPMRGVRAPPAAASVTVRNSRRVVISLPPCRAVEEDRGDVAECRPAGEGCQGPLQAGRGTIVSGRKFYVRVRDAGSIAHGMDFPRRRARAAWHAICLSENEKGQTVSKEGRHDAEEDRGGGFAVGARGRAGGVWNARRHRGGRGGRGGDWRGYRLWCRKGRPHR